MASAVGDDGKDVDAYSNGATGKYQANPTIITFNERAKEVLSQKGALSQMKWAWRGDRQQ
jgi:hypothetical protein